MNVKIQQYNESTFTILDKIIGKDKANKISLNLEKYQQSKLKNHPNFLSRLK